MFMVLFNDFLQSLEVKVQIYELIYTKQNLRHENLNFTPGQIFSACTIPIHSKKFTLYLKSGS